jgi:hypothetical protein
MDRKDILLYIFLGLSQLAERPFRMAEKHSGWSRTSRGARASSQGAARGTRTENRSRVDNDGVPLKYTDRSRGFTMPPEFYALFRVDPDAALAKDWTAGEAT